MNVSFNLFRGGIFGIIIGLIMLLFGCSAHKQESHTFGQLLDDQVSFSDEAPVFKGYHTTTGETVWLQLETPVAGAVVYVWNKELETGELFGFTPDLKLQRIEGGGGSVYVKTTSGQALADTEYSNTVSDLINGGLAISHNAVSDNGEIFIEDLYRFTAKTPHGADVVIDIKDLDYCDDVAHNALINYLKTDLMVN